MEDVKGFLKTLSVVIGLYLIGFLVGTGLFYYNNHKTPVPKRVQTKLGSIVRFVRGDQTFCSGTVVSDHVIITAAHCVLVETEFGAFINPEPIEIRDQDNVPRGVTAQVIYASPQMDQAMMVGDFKNFEHRRIITNAKHLTEIKDSNPTLTACGYPLGGSLYCAKLEFDKQTQFVWTLKGVLLPGMSGGPAMLEDGTVVAVNIAVEQSDALVSPIYNLTQNLRRVRK